MLRLKELRKQNKLTQQQLAEMLGVTQAALSGWENEKFGIDNGSLLKCAKIFDETKEQLLSQDGLMFDGVPATEEDVQKIIMAMQMGMEMIKKENKAKFTPKKYRKDNWGIAYE